jgi:SAM-dependent methyltransferase
MTETHVLNIHALHHLSEQPELYEPGEPVFWDDPHISQGLLDAHLNPDTEAASRHPDTIEAIVNWLLDYLKLGPDAAWLDLGCGPGLYTSRLARRGLQVTGVDFSRRSLNYAREYAAQHDLPITYRYQNYLTLEDAAEYDVVSLIYGDFCPLFPAERSTLLERIHRALKPGGRFVFDVSTPVHHAQYGLKAGWYTAPDGGFWKPGPHLVLERGFTYPEDIFLDQYIILLPDGSFTVYRFWFQDYVPDRITAELAAHGFAVRAVWSDLTGTLYTPDSTWLGVVAERV